MAIRFGSFSDDIALEILTRLPLKDAVRFSSLNHSIYATVNDPNFLHHRAMRVGPIFLHLAGYGPHLFSRIPSLEENPNPITIEDQIDILDSCHGILLLRHDSCLYVFNPVSGGIIAAEANRAPKFPKRLVGLAIGDFGIKVVCLRQMPAYLWVDVISLSGGRAIFRSSRRILRKKFNPSWDKNLRPIFAHGCVHWLESNGERIVTYDVATKRTRIVPGPLNGSGSDSIRHMWFGFADNRLQLVLNQPGHGIAIYSHDVDLNQWRVMRRIKHITLEPYFRDVQQRTVFFDGRYLFQMVRRNIGEGDLCSYDTVEGKREAMGEIEYWADNEGSFVHYRATLVKVSGWNVGSPSCPYLPGLKEGCRQLQQLLKC